MMRITSWYQKNVRGKRKFVQLRRAVENPWLVFQALCLVAFVIFLSLNAPDISPKAIWSWIENFSISDLSLIWYIGAGLVILTLVILVVMKSGYTSGGKKLASSQAALGKLRKGLASSPEFLIGILGILLVHLLIWVSAPEFYFWLVSQRLWWALHIVLLFFLLIAGRKDKTSALVRKSLFVAFIVCLLVVTVSSFGNDDQDSPDYAKRAGGEGFDGRVSQPEKFEGNARDFYDGPERAFVMERFSDNLVLADIAACESRFRQFDADGNVLRNKNPGKPDDLGLFQVNEVHLPTADSLGLDLTDREDNADFADWLFSQKGTAPWDSSAFCWRDRYLQRPGTERPAFANLEMRDSLVYIPAGGEPVLLAESGGPDFKLRLINSQGLEMLVTEGDRSCTIPGDSILTDPAPPLHKCSGQWIYPSVRIPSAKATVVRVSRIRKY